MLLDVTNMFVIHSLTVLLLVIGTGKTATFAISTLQALEPSVVECQALVLAPTRELAQQIVKVSSHEVLDVVRSRRNRPNLTLTFIAMSLS